MRRLVHISATTLHRSRKPHQSLPSVARAPQMTMPSTAARLLYGVRDALVGTLVRASAACRACFTSVQSSSVNSFLVLRTLRYRAEYSVYAYLSRDGDVNSLKVLGACHDFGRGVQQDYEKAAEFYERSAEGGDAEAAGLLGVLYADGTGVEQDYGKAAELYERAVADGGNA